MNLIQYSITYLQMQAIKRSWQAGSDPMTTISQMQHIVTSFENHIIERFNIFKDDWI
jgi:hypothetical protein